jgi:polar amino acid transport system permease protein
MNASVIIGRLLESSLINLELFAVTLLLGLPLGLIIAFGSMSRFTPLRWLSQTFVWIIRGTPLMLQIIIVFYGPGLIWGGQAMGRMEAAALAFVINYACYFSEIFRGGIQSMPAGQKEAGEVLGMTKSQIFFKVTLLQVIKRIVPPMGNEFITLVKDTSLARIIANKEIIMMAQEYASSDALIWPLFSTAVFFLIACGILTLLLNYAEKKLSYFK